MAGYTQLPPMQFPQAQQQFPQMPLQPPSQTVTPMPFGQPMGLPSAMPGAGLPPQDAFAQQQAAPMSALTQAPGAEAAGGFSDKNVTLSNGGMMSKLYSWTGLAAIAGTVALGAGVIWWFKGKGEKELISNLSQDVKDKTVKVIEELKPKYDKFIEGLTGEPDATKIETVKNEVKDDLETLQTHIGAKKLSEEEQTIHTNLINAFEAKAMNADEAKKAKEDFKGIHDAYSKTFGPQLKKPEETAQTASTVEGDAGTTGNHDVGVAGNHDAGVAGNHDSGNTGNHDAGTTGNGAKNAENKSWSWWHPSTWSNPFRRSGKVAGAVLDRLSS